MEKYRVGLSPELTPEKILGIFLKVGKLNILDLRDEKSCRKMKLGKSIGSGANGTVYLLKEERSDGLEVVVKNIELKDDVYRDGDVIIIHETLCEIIMSAYFNKYYVGSDIYSFNFPYFKGFFNCNGKAQILMERLDVSLYDYLYGSDFQASTFAGLLFQLSFCLLLLRKEKIIHSDLHSRNLMLVSSKNKKYKGISLNQNEFSYKADGYYSVPNRGYVLKFIDFDFSARHAYPKLCPKKLWTRPMDRYNVQYDWRPDYDLMVILMFLIDALFYRKALSPELDLARELVLEWVEYLMGVKPTSYSKREKVLKQFVSNFNRETNRPLPGKEWLGLKLDLQFWLGRFGISKSKDSPKNLMGAL